VVQGVYAHGAKIENRIDLLVQILNEEFQTLLDDEHGQARRLGALHRFLDDVVINKNLDIANAQTSI